MDSQNFNAYILQKLGCSPAECERRIKGKNVPIMVIHALVQLRETYNTVSHRFSCSLIGCLMRVPPSERTSEITANNLLR